ncbi:hypothetical protein NE237_000539 [Protea cynaroides]|uniref:Neprosin PEP catalytic domain-containing protein n=1 Tax=Protea cynaroides TaxID=273540 RepID=A0A9Q0QXA3_9MAGN|nr:hypothetical protein NE237_000539 [Protea cynaroides]
MVVCDCIGRDDFRKARIITSVEKAVRKVRIEEKLHFVCFFAVLLGKVESSMALSINWRELILWMLILHSGLAVGLSQFGKNQDNDLPHHYAAEGMGNRKTTELSVYGTLVVMNLWNPKLRLRRGQFSLAQIWVSAMDEHIEAGWHVSPKLYNDYHTHLFVFWTVSYKRARMSFPVQFSICSQELPKLRLRRGQFSLAQIWISAMDEYIEVGWHVSPKLYTIIIPTYLYSGRQMVICTLATIFYAQVSYKRARMSFPVQFSIWYLLIMEPSMTCISL